MQALDSYVAPSRTRPGFWRVLVGLVVIGAAWVAGSIIVLIGWMVINLIMLGNLDAALAELQELRTGGTPGRIAVMLSTFTGIWFGIWAATRLVHDQRFTTIFAPFARIAWRDLGLGIALAAAVAIPSLGLALSLVVPERTELDLATWAMWLAPLSLAVFVQATGEEMIFRGYLLQQLARRSRSPLVWAVIPSLLFGALHYDGGLPDNGGVYYIAVTLLMGLTLATLVWRSGNLWSAAGLHVGNNILSLTGVGAVGLPGGTQLWLFASEDLEMVFRADLAASVLMLAIVLSPLGRVFGTGHKGYSADAEVFR